MILNGRTDANGAITLKDVKPGTYTVEVDGPSYAASFEKTFQQGNASSAAPHEVISAINIILPANPDANRKASSGNGGRMLFSAETPYCSGTAGKGMRFTFTVPPNTGTDSGGPQAYVEAKYEFLAVILIMTGW